MREESDTTIIVDKFETIKFCYHFFLSKFFELSAQKDIFKV